jgi:hypothetical protein
MSVPEELKQAVELVATIYPAALCVARPEIFTNGVSRAWLDKRLGSIDRHICISDGSAVKVIEGMENHVFFFDLAQHRSRNSFRNLAEWAPELFIHLRSQINSFHAVELRDTLVQPPTTLLLPPAPIETHQLELHEFSLPSNSIEESAQWIIERGAIADVSFDSFQEITYVPMTESNARDADFCSLAAQVVAKAYFQADQCVLLRIPAYISEQSDYVARIQTAIQAIRSAKVVVPRVPAKNVFLVLKDPPEDYLESVGRRLTMLIDETFEFWKYTRGLYNTVQCIRYLFEGDLRRLQRVVESLTQIFGPSPIAADVSEHSESQMLTWRRKKSPSRKKKHGC